MSSSAMTEMLRYALDNPYAPKHDAHSKELFGAGGNIDGDFSVPTLFGDDGHRLVDHGDHSGQGFGDANGVINYQFCKNYESHTDADRSIHMLCMIDTQPNADKTGAYDIYNVSRLNYLFRQPALRRAYAATRLAALKFTQNFEFLGVHQDNTDAPGLRESAFRTYHMAKAARFLWPGCYVRPRNGISHNTAEIGDRVYLVLHRVPFKPTFRAAKRQKVEDKQQDWMLQFDLYISHGGDPPPLDMYVNAESLGRCYFVGTVHKIIDSTKYSTENIALAEEAMFPTEGNGTYQKAIVQCPNIQLILRM